MALPVRTRFFGATILMISLMGFSVPGHAQSQKTDIRPQANRVTGEALLKAFTGVTHAGAYNFNLEGAPSDRYVETHFADGRTRYMENDDVFDGAWLIRQNMLCFVYKHSALAGGCFRVYKIKNCYYYYSSALIEREDELDRDYWTARSVREGEEPQCVAAIS